MPLTACHIEEFLIESKLNGFFFFFFLSGGGGGECSIAFALRIFHRVGEVK